MPEFKDKVVLVTGASSGLGKEIALAFAKEQAIVVICNRREDKAKDTLKAIQDTGAECKFIQCDVSNSESVQKLIQSTIESYGKLNFAINNAGIIGETATVDEYTEKIWDKVVNTNLKGTWLGMKYQIPEILKAGGGSIVNVSSVMGLVGTPFKTAVYSATKHGIIGLTKSVAIEFATKGIRVNAVCPGVIETEAYSKMFSAENQDVLKKLHPMNRVATPEEVANAVVWLCSSKASFITGTAIPVDGGYTAQ